MTEADALYGAQTRLALDNFKSSQACDVREGNWTMAAVDESKVPPADRARKQFVDAMDRWDAPQADAAVAASANAHHDLCSPGRPAHSTQGSSLGSRKSSNPSEVRFSSRASS